MAIFLGWYKDNEPIGNDQTDHYAVITTDKVTKLNITWGRYSNFLNIKFFDKFKIKTIKASKVGGLEQINLIKRSQLNVSLNKVNKIQRNRNNLRFKSSTTNSTRH